VVVLVTDVVVVVDTVDVVVMSAHFSKFAAHVVVPLSYAVQILKLLTQGPSPMLHKTSGQNSVAFTNTVVTVVVVELMVAVAVVVVVVNVVVVEVAVVIVVVISAHRSKLSGHVVSFTYMRQTLKLLMQGPTPKRHAFTPVQNSSVEFMVVVVTVVATVRQSTSVSKQRSVSPFGW